jgi:serpin B
MKRILVIIFIMASTMNSYSQEKIVESNNVFALNIYKATKPDSVNFFISPFSLNIALFAVNEGARASTRREMDNLLSINSINNRAQQYSNLIKRTMDPDGPDSKRCINWSDGTPSKNSLFLANSLWIKDEVSIENSFINEIKSNYHSDIFSFNLQNISLANKELNEWVSKKTNNKISEISGSNKDIKLSIVNAIYFLGEWESGFDTKMTKKKRFYTINKRKVEIDYMKKQYRYRYYEDSEVQSLYLPYKCNQFSMIIILPRKRRGILETENKLNINYIKKIDSLNSYSEVMLSLPKFRIESEIKPKEEIIKMGYPVMFSDTADFTGISSIDSLKIDEIIHKTFIEIDEKKTEAVAVSKVDMVIVGYGGGNPPPPPPKVFNADHPFIFLIKDNRTNAILFAGRFVKQ